jgi:hypothetical protein
MNEAIPDLKIESINDENGHLFLLEQDGGGNIHRVAIHAIHIRLLAEKMGLVQTSDPQAAKAIATLQRRMTALRDRIEFLQGYLANHSDHEHADLTFEMTYATATLDLADEFCLEFEEQQCNGQSPSAISQPDAAQAKLI